MRPFAFIVMVFVSGCGAGTVPSPVAREQTSVLNPDRPLPEDTKRFLALGDSYTIGESVAVEGRWPVQLVAALRKDGLAIADPKIIARTGWTTAELMDALDNMPPKGPYDLVSLLIGVNNQYQGRDLVEYRKQFVDLLGRSVVLAGGNAERVIVVSIPDWGATPFAKKKGAAATIGKAIDQFNDVNREETKKAGAVYVEITVASRRAATEAKLIAEDGLHPSAAMYAEWTAAVLPEAKKALASGGK